MSTEIVSEIPEPIKSDNSTDHLKSVLQTLTDQSSVLKGLINTVRTVIKENDRQSKELEKLRNKRSRTKTERAANALPSGITKPVAISDDLAKFLGVQPGTLVPRNEVTKGVSNFVKTNGLSDPANKQKFILDDRPEAKVLKVLLGDPAEDVTYFNLQRYLKHHYLPMPATEKPVVVSKKLVVETVVPPSAPPDSEQPPTPMKKKVVLVKKKKPTELTEEA
jgi:hypothetical protein